MEVKTRFSSGQPSISRTARLLEVLFITLAILYFGSVLFIPMFFGLLVSIVLYPVCKWQETRHIPKSIAITNSLAIVTVLFGALTWLLWFELTVFSRDIPAITQKLHLELPQFQEWIEAKVHLSLPAQEKWLAKAMENVLSTLSYGVKNTINYIMHVGFILFMIPIFAALFLYHRRNFVRSLELLFGQRNKLSLDAILQQTIHTYFNYIKGMLLVYLIVGILNSVGLMALGIRHAILFGMVTAVMTVIPYLGIIVSALLPITVAFLTKDSIWYPLGIVAVFAFVQYLEANVIFPKVVGAQLNVSTWATLVAIITGGLIWGVAGMVLFIPFVAILKIVSDHVEEWKSLNALLKR